MYTIFQKMRPIQGNIQLTHKKSRRLNEEEEEEQRNQQNTSNNILLITKYVVVELEDKLITKHLHILESFRIHPTCTLILQRDIFL